MTMMDMNFKYCHKIMKKHSKSFSYAFDLLPEDQRKAVWAIYAVCRKIDDSIDVYGDIQFLNLQCVNTKTKISLKNFKFS